MANNTNNSNKLPRQRPTLKKVYSFQPRVLNSISGENSESDFNIPRYTSLKDVLINSPTSQHGSPRERSLFDASNIMIRNELVKHAASSYVQSASLLPNQDHDQDQDKLTVFREKIKSYSSRTHVYCKDIFRSCLDQLLMHIGDFVVRARRSLSDEEEPIADSNDRISQPNSQHNRVHIPQHKRSKSSSLSSCKRRKESNTDFTYY